ncbi:hypothetical protein J3Q64DRAFT_1840480 [Phycomyces blakesleeanus]|uniref:Uncharacterized protein n=2 Tax=Phycomyces blakesleeanus TaxID=4837 RepID=A0A167K8L8_PHYB8|nr:hypothetical protein PHYBLDRAFT_69356 [Phycomyces blakesleeanus NRRL 1555(-)]OAD67487.1 hypothetical protein PHYBLDRAFT_69356 [Phycomyces blakesleeanus NRRL 1555(-)]|eukprot:XP_018285527.1 hypothetical protein PHYBLDRAFT_69356 [Phycomyces blakesleeanus NRRL 1555(-)]
MQGTTLRAIGGLVIAIGIILQCTVVIGSLGGNEAQETFYVGRYSSDDEFLQFGLWSYCVGIGSRVTRCGSSASDLSIFNGDSINIAMVATYLESTTVLSMAADCLYILSFVISIISALIIFSRKDGKSCVSATLPLITFFVLLSSLLCLVLMGTVVDSKGKKDNLSIQHKMGAIVWISISSAVCIFISAGFYLASLVERKPSQDFTQRSNRSGPGLCPTRSQVANNGGPKLDCIDHFLYSIGLFGLPGATDDSVRPLRQNAGSYPTSGTPPARNRTTANTPTPNTPTTPTTRTSHGTPNRPIRRHSSPPTNPTGETSDVDTLPSYRTIDPLDPTRNENRNTTPRATENTSDQQNNRHVHF